MEKKGSMSWRKKLALVAAGVLAAITTPCALYVAGVGGGPELDGVGFVTLEDGTVRLRIHGVGVGMTREEVDASPLAAGLYTPGTKMSLYRLPGESGTELAVMPELDDDGRVMRLNVHYDGGRLALMRVASRYRALFKRVGGTCDWRSCSVTADPERTELGALMGQHGGWKFVALSAVR